MFSVKLLETIKAKTPAYLLIREGKCLTEIFYDERIRKNKRLVKEYFKLLRRFEHHLDGHRLPVPQQLNMIKNGDQTVGYEIKTDNLRLYFFQAQTGKIIATCGHKKTQPKDVERFKEVIKTFKKHEKSRVIKIERYDN